MKLSDCPPVCFVKLSTVYRLLCFYDDDNNNNNNNNNNNYVFTIVVMFAL